MGRYNLLDEPWISVVVDKKGNTNEVSMLEFFEHAHEYLDFGGDTKTQDFAVMRMLLAVVYTVFSRFNAEGKPYEYLELDNRYRPTEKIDEYYLNRYEENLYETWIDLWEQGKFPEIVGDYLEKWRDRFFLYDEEYPFFQLTKRDLDSRILNKNSPGSVSGKKINRKISESNNKTALFSPKYDYDRNKEILSNQEIIRWLITYQGYTGVDDKVDFVNEKYTVSKGWLYDIGGIYLKGENIFETMILNTVLVNKENDNIEKIQLPCWEISSDEYLSVNLNSNIDKIDTSASLLTVWSRAILMDSKHNSLEPFSFGVVKLPTINPQNKFLESMTIWQYNKNGKNKGTYTPKKHQAKKAIWRSFGLISGIEYDDNNNKKNIKNPGVIEWINKLRSNYEIKGLKNRYIKVCSISMQDDGNPTSRIPTDEILDTLDINEFILTDREWSERIYQVVEKSKYTIEFLYKQFIEDIMKIRNIDNKSYIETSVEEIYFRIDTFFRIWLANIKYDDEKEKRVLEWNIYLKKITMQMADEIFESASYRDFKGVEQDGKMKNIATVYNRFIYLLNKKLIITKGGDE